MTSPNPLCRGLSLAVASIALAAACGSGVAPGRDSRKSTVDPTPRPSGIEATILGTAQDFAALAGSTLTNTGPSVLDANVGVSPGSAVTGFPPGLTAGVILKGDAVALQAQSDVTAAYTALAGLPCAAPLTGQDLAGKRLTAGVYCFTSEAQLTGTLTLDAEGRADATFVFQIGSKLTVASGARVLLVNAASPCNVFWQVGSSAARIGAGSTFVGNILALTSIVIETGAQLDGRALARNGAVTLDTNLIRTRNCSAAPADGGVGGPDAGNGGGNGDGGNGGGGAGDGGNGGGGAGDGGNGGGGNGGGGTGDAGNGGGGNGGGTGGGAGGGGPIGTPTGDCCAGTLACGSECFNLKNDANNCGACGVRCTASQVCQGSVCGACPVEDTQCPDQCANLKNDSANCGACGHACPGSQACNAGVCGPCDGTVCGNSCVELSNDKNNCGACGKACGVGECCTAGACSAIAGTTIAGANSAVNKSCRQ